MQTLMTYLCVAFAVFILVMALAAALGRHLKRRAAEGSRTVDSEG
ncbi:hypothetical protein AB0425_17735 [Actinosynnema sp. NPDC051121]